MNTCQTFKNLSTYTWRIINRAYNSKLTFGEDAITSIILDQIIENCKNAVVVQDTRPKESKCGCDFEFWIQDFNGWNRYAVQAKKIDFQSQTYKSLKHTVGKIQILQIDILEAYAQNKALPLYCLYNSSPQQTSNNEDIYGCAIINTTSIRRAINQKGGKSYSALRPMMHPWHYLVCPSEKIHLKNIFANYSGKFFYDELPEALLKLRKMNKRLIAKNFEKLDIFDDNFPNKPSYPKSIIIIPND